MTIDRILLAQFVLIAAKIAGLPCSWWLVLLPLEVAVVVGLAFAMAYGQLVFAAARIDGGSER